jgi:transcriptional regulator with XRE-family HTH domain
VQGTSGFGQWLKQRCDAEGLSLRQASARIGVSHGTIAKIIEGASPAPETIKRIAQAFGQNGNEKLALEDSLLILAGYRTERPKGKDVSPDMGRLMDVMSGFSESQLKMVTRFAEFLAEMEKQQ